MQLSTVTRRGLSPALQTSHFSRQAQHGAPSPLSILIFLGSNRTNGPPRPTRVGERVTSWVQTELKRRGHNTKIVDPLLLPLGSGHAPHFSFKKGQAPDALDELAGEIGRADAYVMCTPEYNHAPGPALLNMLAHFGGSLFAFKPSAVVSYSQGQWGGVRAAAGLRPVLSELGCLPVSSMVHIPRAHEVLDDGGEITANEQEWERHGARTWHQLEWWGSAAAQHRAILDPAQGSPPLLRNPSQRNAP